jgi:hypothetical protein
MLLGAFAAVGLALVLHRMSRDPFADKLQYELNNRAFARIAMIRAAAQPARPELREFWRAYEALELLNQRKYRAIAKKHGLKPQAVVVAVKTWAIEIAVRMFPAKVLDGLTDATIEYVAELGTLRELAPREDHAFFDYAIAQEQAQARALVHARQGRFDLGSSVLRDFVAAQD